MRIPFSEDAMRTFVIFIILIFVSLNVFADGKNDRVGNINAEKSKLQSHCIGDERVLFSCHLGTKVASICASPDLGKSRGYLQYRFGSIDKIELEIPKRRGHARAVAAIQSVCGSSNCSAYVRFVNEDYRYFVFSNTMRGNDDPDGASNRIDWSGVVVMKADKKIYAQKCSDVPFEMNIGADNYSVTTLEDNGKENPWDISSGVKP